MSTFSSSTLHHQPSRKNPPQYTPEPSLAYDQQLPHSTCIASLPSSNTDSHLFLFTAPNAVHIVNYVMDEDINTLYQHEFTDSRRIVSCDANLLGMQYEYEIYDMNAVTEDSRGSGTELPCKHRYSWRDEASASPLRRAIMSGDNDTRVLLLTHDSCMLHDYASNEKPRIMYEKPRRLYCVDWDRLQQKIVMGVQRDVVEYDMRANGVAFEIKNAHEQRIRDIQYNPQRPYYFISAGDDNRMRYWDIRKPDAALKVICGHSHWINRVRFNPLNDQLLLSASSDATICLWNLPSLAKIQAESGSLMDSTEELPVGDDSSSVSSTKASRGEDKLACRITEHDDSVTDICWSKQSPWVFASVSYDGRCVIQHVPNQLKYEILDI